MRWLKLQGRRYRLPGSLKEVTAKQLEWLCRRVLRGQCGQQLQLGWVLDMVGGHLVREAGGKGVYLQLGKRKQLYAVDSTQLRDLALYADYLYDQYGAFQCALFGLPEDTIPEALAGYEAGFYDVKLDEFLYSEDMRSSLVESLAPSGSKARPEGVLSREEGVLSERLCQWLGVLHRVRVDRGHGMVERIPLDRQSNAERGALVGALQPWQWLAMSWAYEGSLAHVAGMFPELFEVDPGERGLPREKGMAVGLIYALCGDQIAQLPVVRETNLWDALFYLQALGRYRNTSR